MFLLGQLSKYLAILLSLDFSDLKEISAFNVISQQAQVSIYPVPPTREGWNTKSIFKLGKAGLN